LNHASARIGVVIPCYRVARHIEAVVRGLPPWIDTIIAVVDASPDDTEARLRALDDPRLVVLVHEHNRGVGGAMQTGFAEALRRGLDVLVKMDGDGQMDPAYLRPLLEPVLAGRADMSKGNRYCDLRALRQMPPIRILGNGILTFLVKAASGHWNLFDPANGYLALRADLWRRIEQRLPDRYFFESGLLIELGILRAVVVDVDIPARYGDERSSLSVTRTILGFPPRLLIGLLRRVFWRYFVHDFSAVSLFLLLGLPSLLLGLFYGASIWNELQRTQVYASAGQVMFSAMPIILGFQLLLQAIVLDIANAPTRPVSRPLGAATRES
jgi:dolichol-phosphate mannosyltransferase